MPTTSRKPLPAITRAKLIEKTYPDIWSVISVPDYPDDDVWSKNLDEAIETLIQPFGEGYYTPILFHSRDSFKEVYTGKFTTEEVPHADLGISGTLHRNYIATHPEHTAEFARGVIWANLNKFPTVYSTVDIAAFNLYSTDRYSKIILITKAGRGGLMFPGGFADPASLSDEDDANRELEEETGFRSYTPIEYVGSTKVEDWRYAGEPDVLRTRLFVTEVGDKYGTEPVAGDDAETAAWYRYFDLAEEDFNPCHRPLFRMLQEYTK